MQSRLYEYQINIESVPHGQPLVVGLTGFMNAGSVVELTDQFLMDDDSANQVLSFDMDQLFDYRGRRPQITFDGTQFLGFEAPTLQLVQLHDSEGKPYLLLCGDEPDYQWQSVGGALVHIIEELEISSVASIQAVPTPVPHTRPVHFTVSGTDLEFIAEHSVWRPHSVLSAGFQAYLESLLMEVNVPTYGMTAHVPHYLAETSYPPGAVAMLDMLGCAGVGKWDIDSLQQESLEFFEKISTQTKDNEEFARQVHTLETQHDEFLKEMRQRRDMEDLPSADELGAEFEEYLAKQFPDAD